MIDNCAGFVIIIGMVNEKKKRCRYYWSAIFKYSFPSQIPVFENNLKLHLLVGSFYSCKESLD
jgi:hypothetical protein